MEIGRVECSPGSQAQRNWRWRCSGRAAGEGLASGDRAGGGQEYLQLAGCLVGVHVPLPVQHPGGGKRDLTRSPSS